MNVTVPIPDDLATRLTAAGEDLSRRALEGLGLEEYKAGRITRPELRRLLGFETRNELDGFLKSHAVVEDLPTLEGFERERQDLAERSTPAAVDVSPQARPIWEIIADNMKDVPAEDFRRLPKDGASQIDHYLYGHPKR